MYTWPPQRGQETSVDSLLANLDKVAAFPAGVALADPIEPADLQPADQTESDIAAIIGRARLRERQAHSGGARGGSGL